MPENAEIIENFYGVYLLCCENKKYYGRTYIGYTVNPSRRIMQHNKGKKYGGAWRTSNRGPWTMVMIVHGFPNNLSALRFEWAWQHPHDSRRLNHVQKKSIKEKVFDFKLRVLSEMLQVGPWRRLPLTVRWLNDKYARDLPKSPPVHMPISSGSVISKKLEESCDNPENCSIHTFCDVCQGSLEGNKAIHCLDRHCSMKAHIVCLARHFLRGSTGEYVPIEGDCVKCKRNMLWGDLIRKSKGCYNNLDLAVTVDLTDFD